MFWWNYTILLNSGLFFKKSQNSGEHIFKKIGLTSRELVYINPYVILMILKYTHVNFEYIHCIFLYIQGII